MDMKKILTLTIIAIALFSCMSIASAGLFDFGSGNSTYTFDGFTLDLPSDTNFKNSTSDMYDFDMKTYWFAYSDKENPNEIMLGVSNGSNISVDDFVKYWEDMGAESQGNYDDWTIIKVDQAMRTSSVGEDMDDGSDISLTVKESGYILVKQDGSKLILIKGENLDALKNIVSTYKET